MYFQTIWGLRIKSERFEARGRQVEVGPDRDQLRPERFLQRHLQQSGEFNPKKKRSLDRKPINYILIFNYSNVQSIYFCQKNT
jgi:hypothetical protein